ncbi:MAG: Ig-like domain-containing protein [Caldimonas sp.]
MKSLKWVLAIATLSLVAACGGGGGNAGDPLFGGGGGNCSGSAASAASSACVVANSIDVLTSAVQVGSGGETATISAVVKGAGNVSLPGAAVTFSVDTGTLTSPTITTDASGVAKVTFSPGSNRTNRTATITVRSGSATNSIAVDVVGTTLKYQGVTTIPLAGPAVTLTVLALDSRSNAIPNLPIAVSSSLGNGLSATTITTDAQGVASVDYTAVNAGSDVLTFTGGGATSGPTVLISPSQFSFVTPPAGTTVVVGTSQALTVQYKIAGTPQAGKTINFSATAGIVAPSSAVTDAAGQATVSITSATASPAVVQATVVGAAAQTTLPIVFVAQVPARLVLQVSPTAIGPNPAGTSAQQAQLRATVVDANGNPVLGSTVTFNRLADPSGGTLSQASAITDGSGQATVNYIAGASTTANNGVQIRASVLGSPGVFGDTQLTVNQSALFIALGTGNVIGNLDEQTYKKDWVVYVTDSNGVAVPNVNLTIKVLPLEYRKGHLVFQGGFWTYDVTTLFTCRNEDLGALGTGFLADGTTPDPKAYNGIIDPGEDIDGSNSLQPGNVISLTTAASTTASATGIARTDTSGRATITLLYAESYVPWVKVQLVAQANVTGTESSTTAIFYVVGLASDFNAASNPPAGVISPFGQNDCVTPN